MFEKIIVDCYGCGYVISNPLVEIQTNPYITLIVFSIIGLIWLRCFKAVRKI